KNKIKTLALMADEFDAAGKKKSSRASVVLMRGDHQLNEAKLNGTVATATRAMEEADIEDLFNSRAEYRGPVGVECARDLNDENGFWLPSSIAPFEVVIAPVNMKDEAVRNAAEDIAKKLEGAGLDVILDDRDERPGVKFKDADLVGIPFRVTVGKKVTEGTVE